MIIINSGAYVIPELQAELGRIPPCMLPVGNRKLIEHQIHELRKQHRLEKIYVTLPESYCLSLSEQRLLDALDVQPIATRDDFSLAEAILFALNTCDIDTHGVIRLVHGDTLIMNLPSPIPDHALGVAYCSDDYDWQMEYTDREGALVWCGLFSFRHRHDLIQTLALSRGNFVQAVQDYRRRHPIQLLQLDHWHDLGHVNTYFRSRAAVTTQRAFNTLQVVQGVVHKTGEPDIKIQAEGNWFDRLPVRLRRFIPQLIDKGINHTGQSYYQLEYLPIMPLNELFVHGRNSASEWRRLFELIDRFLQLCAIEDTSVETRALIGADFKQLITQKTQQRLKQYSNSTGFDLTHPMQYAEHHLPSIQQIAYVCIERTLKLNEFPAVIHGDLGFSNVLFDSRADQIKVIDPRGLTAQAELSIYGDQKYDLAKLAHSVIGLYDFIIAGRYCLIEYDLYHVELNFELDERINEIQKIFDQYEFGHSLTIAQIMPLVVLLFLSMLPLHQDRPDRQRAMLANAVRLYLLTT